METLARAMQAAHSRNVVHRDLKPASVLRTADGTPRIADFGLARQLDADRGETQAGTVMGTTDGVVVYCLGWPRNLATCSHADPCNPRPLWDHCRGLFRAASSPRRCSRSSPRASRRCAASVKTTHVQYQQANARLGWGDIVKQGNRVCR